MLQRHRIDARAHGLAHEGRGVERDRDHALEQERRPDEPADLRGGDEDEHEDDQERGVAHDRDVRRNGAAAGDLGVSGRLTALADLAKLSS